MTVADPGPRPDDLFLCHGARGEYVLAPIAEELRQRDLHVVEVVGGDVDVGAALRQVLPHEGRVVLLTSAHVMHDGPSMQDLVGSPGCLSPLQVQAIADPVITVFVPHDLQTPILIEEMHYLSHLDLYLAATPEELMLRRKVDVELVGWIKRRDPASPPFERRGRALWLTMGMEIGVHRAGVQAKVDGVRPHIRDWCDIKLGPNDIVAELEQALRAEGASVLDRNLSAADLVPHYDVIVSNGPTSAVREAAMMGKPVFVLTHKGIFSGRASMGQYADLPNVRFVPTMDDIPEDVVDLPPRLLPFDMGRAMDAIFSRL